MKLIRWTMMALMAVGLIYCSKDKDEPGIEPNTGIVINEVMPKNTGFGSDQDGEFDDWIELYNLSDEDIDLSGYYLTDSKKELTKWQFPAGTTIEKNGHLVVWADGDSTTQAGLHTPYKLSALGETILLLTPGMDVIDEVEYPAVSLQQSYSRLPDGTGEFVWASPTFEAENKAGEPGIDINKSIVINEMMPKNTQFGSDQDGQFDDWIELFNLANVDIDISGYYLTDSKNELTKWKFPEGTTLEKNGYLIVWADGDSTQVGLHTPYKLSALGETVLLLTPDRKVIQEVKYPATILQQSYARKPNGTGNFDWSTPTYNTENK